MEKLWVHGFLFPQSFINFLSNCATCHSYIGCCHLIHIWILHIETTKDETKACTMVMKHTIHTTQVLDLSRKNFHKVCKSELNKWHACRWFLHQPTLVRLTVGGLVYWVPTSHFTLLCYSTRLKNLLLGCMCIWRKQSLKLYVYD